MIKLIRITNPDDASLKQLVSLYEEAFPAEERRNIEQLKRLIVEQPSMYFNAVECDGELSGLFVYWDFDGFHYLEHLAVYAEMRNKKIGQQVLDYVQSHLQGIRLLEVEPTDNEMAARRVGYYERNGYRILDRTYIQPSYDGVRNSIPLWIMGNQAYENPALLAKHIHTIKEKVYTGNY